MPLMQFFGKIGHSEVVIVQLISAKCMSRCYTTDSVEVPLRKKSKKGVLILFAVNGCFMNLFKTKCHDTVHAFGCFLSPVLQRKGKENFCKDLS